MNESRMEVIDFTKELMAEDNGPQNRFDRNGLDVILRIEAIEAITEQEQENLQNLMTNFVCLKHFISIIFQ